MPSPFLHVIDILGTFSFAVSGAFMAMEKKLDPFGVLVLAFVTAIGGGTLRDILIGNLPVSWLQNETAIWIIFCSALATMIFGSLLKQFTTTLFLFDAMGLGLYTITGIGIAMDHRFGMGISIALGTVTACFGGVVRDVLLNNIPLLFRKEIYALACIAGGLLFFGLIRSGLSHDVATVISILVIFTVRVVAVRFHLSLPRFYLPKSTE